MNRKALSDSLLAEYTRVAYYYYKENNTQEQIAKRMNMSRQRVNRILGECLDQGIVQITINASTDMMLLELESILKKKYALKDIRVTDNINPDDIFSDLGRAAGQYLVETLRSNDILGVTRGRTLAALADLMPVSDFQGVVVAQLLGSRNQEPRSTTTNEIVHNIAAKLNARQSLLFAPIVVSSAELKQSLFRDPAFQQAYRTIQSCTVCVAGIGNAQRARELFAQGGVSVPDTLVLEPGQQLTGEVSSHIFDQKGRPIREAYRDHVVSVELEDYMRIPTRIGVGGLPEKAAAIHAAMLGKYINVLIVDTQTAILLRDM